MLTRGIGRRMTGGHAASNPAFCPITLSHRHVEWCDAKEPDIGSICFAEREKKRKKDQKKEKIKGAAFYCLMCVCVCVLVPKGQFPHPSLFFSPAPNRFLPSRRPCPIYIYPAPYNTWFKRLFRIMSVSTSAYIQTLFRANIDWLAPIKYAHYYTLFGH
jgi:hypothetical protein